MMMIIIIMIPRRMLEDNGKVDLKEIGRVGVDWIRLLRIGTRGGLL
jgi:hypothetical protein